MKGRVAEQPEQARMRRVARRERLAGFIRGTCYGIRQQLR
jgi:hypothetical protein